MITNKHREDLGDISEKSKYRGPGIHDSKRYVETSAYVKFCRTLSRANFCLLFV